MTFFMSGTEDISHRGRNLPDWGQFPSGQELCKNEPGNKSQKAGARNQEPVVSRQQTADSRQNTGDKRQEIGDRRQETGDSRQQTADSRQQTADSSCQRKCLTLLNCQKQFNIFINLQDNLISLRYCW